MMRMRMRMMGSAAAAFALMSAGCLDLLLPPESDDGRPSGAVRLQEPLFPEWETPWLASAGAGWVLTFDPDMDAATGSVVEFGWNVPLTMAGFRYMDFSYDDESADAGEAYAVKGYLLYLGAGAGGGSGDVGSYGRFSLGMVHVTGAGVDERGLAGGINVGVNKHHTFEGCGGAGLAAEAGLFLAGPGDISLSGVSLLLGGYLFF